MKFDVLGREVNVEWDHLIVVVGVYFGISILFALLGFIFGFTSGGAYATTTFIDAFELFFSVYLSVIEIIVSPLMGFVFLWMAQRFFKQKKNDGLCRSLAGAHLIFGIVVMLIVFSLTSSNYLRVLGPINFFLFGVVSGLIGGFLNLSLGSFIIYLWMLIFLNMDWKKLKERAQLAIFFALILLIIPEVIDFFFLFQQSNVYSFNYGIWDTLGIIGEWFVFGLLILYYIKDKQLGFEAYVFSGLYLIPVALSSIVYFSAGILDTSVNSGSGFFTDVIARLILLIERLFAIILLYILGKARLK
jgi:hypothetical protein